jgi:hypothetical protein
MGNLSSALARHGERKRGDRDNLYFYYSIHGGAFCLVVAVLPARRRLLPVAKRDASSLTGVFHRIMSGPAQHIQEKSDCLRRCVSRRLDFSILPLESFKLIQDRDVGERAQPDGDQHIYDRNQRE